MGTSAHGHERSVPGATGVGSVHEECTEDARCNDAHDGPRGCALHRMEGMIGVTQRLFEGDPAVPESC
eukprot:scaffold271674_cov19-Tisochrysis_lutea.AAC.1